MELLDARRLAVELMREHGLGTWRLVWDDARTRPGTTRHDRHQISLSKPITHRHSEEQVRHTVLHEIAHALVGADHGHDAAWKRAALALGITPATRSAATEIAAAWEGRCASGHRLGRHRRPSAPILCESCLAAGRRVVVDWRYRGRTVPMTSAYRAHEAQLISAGASRPNHRSWATAPAATTGTPPLAG